MEQQTEHDMDHALLGFHGDDRFTVSLLVAWGFYRAFSRRYFGDPKG